MGSPAADTSEALSLLQKSILEPGPRAEVASEGRGASINPSYAARQQDNFGAGGLHPGAERRIVGSGASYRGNGNRRLNQNAG